MRQRISINSPLLGIILTLLGPSLCVKIANDPQQGTGGVTEQPLPRQRKKQAQRTEPTQFPPHSALVKCRPFPSSHKAQLHTKPNASEKENCARILRPHPGN